MDVRYRFNPDKGICYVSSNAKISLQDIAVYVQNVINDATIDTAFVEIVDLRNVDDIAVSYGMTSGLLSLFQRLKQEKKYLGTIIIVQSPYSFGVARMFQTVFETHGLLVEITASQEEAESKAVEIHSLAGS